MKLRVDGDEGRNKKGLEISILFIFINDIIFTLISFLPVFLLSVIEDQYGEWDKCSKEVSLLKFLKYKEIEQETNY